jgi:nanoRNase/pAp phosphatase (c-di-AMP/oligoRNAs hydrolase)
MPEIHVFYHDNCYDGFGAAWVSHKKLGDAAKYYTYKWDAQLPKIPVNARVYFIDVACSMEQIRELEKQGCGVVVIDHHQTTPDKLKGFDNLIFNNKHSGAVLCWQYWFGDKEMPELLKYIEDRDLWKFAFKETKMIQAVLESYPMNFDIWDKLDINQMIAEAPAIMRLRQQQINSICDQAILLQIAGDMVPIANTPVMMSEVATTLREKYPSAKFTGYFFVRQDEKIQFGLRSVGEFDVSKVAQKFGGGGHKNSAGFEINLDKDALFGKALNQPKTRN